jgi:hypothetical protein
MPYIPQADRPRLDVKVNELAEEIASELVKINGTGEIATFYEKSFLAIYDILYDLETNKKVKLDSKAKLLANEMFDISKARDHRPSWLGEMNYSITRLIQIVPRKMVEKGAWKEEFRYWLFAQTVGALERAALEINKKKIDEKLTYILNGMVGSLFDIKDEYKRRVNTAYEALQIRKSGDCYDAPYHTELEDIKNSNGDTAGYREIMKDFRKVKTEDKKIE